MNNTEQEINQINNKAENPNVEAEKITANAERLQRIESIDHQLASFSDSSTPEDSAKIQETKELEYQSEISKLESTLGQSLSEETKTKIHQNIVVSAIEKSKKEGEQYDLLMTEKKVLEYIDQTLSNESVESFISRPMNADCKVAVMVPAYNESFSNILRSLSSLSEQEEVDPSLYEVDIIVNNKQNDANQNLPAFLVNQESINLIKYINGESKDVPKNLTTEQIEQIEKIKESKININVIDKSSTKTSNEYNNIGIARDRAGAEIVNRFMSTSSKTEGAIATTDCDCTFSKNFIKSLIQSFEQNEINGVSGNLEFEIDPSLPNQELIKKAFNIYIGKDGPKNDYSNESNFKLQKEGALKSGANMVVTAKAWALVGGMPKMSGGEDIRFGKNVEELQGQVAVNYDYTVTTLMRVSERTGLQGNGRIVKKIKESVDDFVLGKSNRIFIENTPMVNKFFNGIIRANENGTLTGNLILDLMKNCEFKKNSTSESKYNELANEVKVELAKPKSEQNIKKVEELILEVIYPYYPEKDVTDKVVG